MNVKNALVAFVCAVSAVACGAAEDSPSEPASAVSAEKLTSATAPTLVNAWRDWSNGVEVGLWLCSSTSRQSIQQFACPVPATHVLVGGGAATEYTGAGALLTSSRPSDDRTSWEGASKDHLTQDPHTLRIWAIGMRLLGLSKDTLETLVHLRTETRAGNVIRVPLAGPPPGEIMLSQGAVVDYQGAGNMLTEIMQTTAASKDHLVADSSTLVFFTFSIPIEIPDWGTLETRRKASPLVSGSGLLTASVSLDNEFVPTGVSGKSLYNGQGRMLTWLGPASTSTITNFRARSKDHRVADSGSVQVWLNQLRRKR